MWNDPEPCNICFSTPEGRIKLICYDCIYALVKRERDRCIEILRLPRITKRDAISRILAVPIKKKPSAS